MRTYHPAGVGCAECTEFWLVAFSHLDCRKQPIRDSSLGLTPTTSLERAERESQKSNDRYSYDWCSNGDDTDVFV